MKSSIKTTKITFSLIMVILVLVIGLAAYVTISGLNAKPGAHKPTSTPEPTPSTTPSLIKVDGDITCDAVITAINTELSAIEVYLPKYDKKETLIYNGTTDIKNSFDRVISALTLESGQMCEVSYDAADNRLYHLYLTEDYWCIEDPIGWEIKLSQGIFSIRSRNYRISENVATLSEKGDFPVGSLKPIDSIKVYGKEEQVFAIELLKGHGTLYAINETSFIGGSFYIDNVYAGQISEGFGLDIQEGSYEVSFSLGDLNGKETVQINRNETVFVDLSKYTETTTEYGYVDFRISPAEAKLYIDNFYYSSDEPVRLPYGTHYVEVTCKGYVTYGYMITVGSENMKITIDLAEQFVPTKAPSPTPDPDDPWAEPTPTIDPDEPGTESTPTPEPEVTGSEPTPTSGVDNPEVDVTPTPAVTPGPEKQNEITLVWYPTSVVTVDDEYAGMTDGSGVLKLTLSYGTHAIGLTRTTLDGTTQPKKYTVTIDETTTYLSFPTGT